MRAGLLALTGLLLGCGATPEPEAQTRPKLVLLVAVDQLRADYLTRFADLYEGGFKTLLAEGAVFENAAYRHATTYTASGHAAISTGMHPVHSGMVGNSWFDYEKDANVNCIADDEYAAVGGVGRAASPRPLLADTFGDLLKAADDQSQVISVSWKDRAAILMGGKKADLAVWFSTDCGCWVTSEYYTKQAPEWMATLNQSNPTERYVGATWDRLIDDVELYNANAREDEFPTEGDGKATTFPHHMPDEGGAGFPGRLAATAFSDELILEAALAALDANDLGSDDHPDVFAVSFSGTDLVGHQYGPLSHEAMDNHLRLDRLLAKLLAAVDAKVGLENVTVALSADHGVMTMPEQTGGETKRMAPKAAIDLVNNAAAKKWPAVGSVVTAAGAGGLYLDLPKLKKNAVDPDEVARFVKEQLETVPEIEEVLLASELEGDDLLHRLFRNSYYAERSPQVFLCWKDSVYPGGARGASHGTPHAFDREVPVILMGRGVQSGRFTDEAGPEDIAPTVETILGIPVQKEDDARVLTEALAE